MKHFITMKDVTLPVVNDIFSMAESIEAHKHALKDKSVILFFPSSSIRTRVTFEKGIMLLGGQPILFPSDALDKKEAIKDVMGYLNNWADCVIVRHSRFACIEEMAKYSAVPVINAMTSTDHPCEILSDLYAISKRKSDYLSLQYTFVGKCGNIGNTWFEASQALGFRFRQCCPKGKGYEISGAEVVHDLDAAMQGSDVVLTDSLPADSLNDFKSYQMTMDAIDRKSTRLNSSHT